MTKNRVIKNAAWIIATKTVQSVLSLIISMITARYLGPTNFGTVNYAASVVAFAIPVMNLGLPGIMVQEIVNFPDDEGKIVGSSLTACFLSGVLSLAGVFVFVMTANHGEVETIIVCMLYSLTIVVQAFDILRYWFQAKLLSKYTAVLSFAAYLIVSGYKIVLLVAGKSVRWFAVSYATDCLLINAGLFIFYKRLGGKKLTFSLDRLKAMVKKSRYYIISGLMIAIFAQTDRVMLKLMINETATGYYSAAVTCAGMTSFIFVAIIDSFRPLIFECKNANEEAFKKNMCRLYSIVIYFALFQSLIVAIFSGFVIRILYGSAYYPATNALRLVVWYTTFSYLGAVRNIWMLAEDKQKLIWKIDISGALLNVALNWLLIPHFGIIGASFASLVTQIFANVFMGWILKPVRENNKLMISGLNPKYLFETIKKVTRKST